MNPGTKRRSSAVPWLILLGLVVWSITWMWLYVARQRKLADRMVAMCRLNQMALILENFESEYGSLPDNRTALLLAKRNKLGLDLTGDTSNAYFRQAIVAGIVDSEIFFHNETGFTRPPDEDMGSPATALAAGEVGFGYLMDGGRGLQSKDGSPGRPVACAPLAFDGNSVSATRFDPATYDGKAVILRADCSVTSHHIEPKTGDAILGSKPILETGPDTVWGSDGKPTILPPLPKR